MTVDEQEALSRKYSNDVIILLPLRSGRFAVFNAMRELCGTIDSSIWEDIMRIWKPVVNLSSKPSVNVTLEDLGL